MRLKPTRLLATGALLLAAFLYWKPAHTYFRTKHELDRQRAEVAALRAERARLERKIAAAGTSPQLIREARRLGLVKPGERLFIVRGIPAWRKNH